MPTGPMDALGAFSHLSENLPQWITRLSDLATYTAAKHAEYAEDFKKHAVVRPRRRKGSSICSIRTDECVRGDAGPSQLADSKQLPSRIPRKRGTDEASIDDDDRYSYVNPRHSLIIQYDGHTQKSLEEMVRNIGTARNNIRRGRMAQLQLGRLGGGGAAFGRSGGRGSEEPRSMSSAVDTPEDQLLSNIRSARVLKSPGPTRTQKDTAFDVADKHLEIAHGMCETAAYQFLRAGNCSTQLSSVEDKFQSLLDLANKEVQRLRAEQSNAESKDETEELAPVEPVKTADKPPAYSGEIEVDDGTASVESLDLTAFRASRLRRC